MFRAISVRFLSTCAAFIATLWLAAAAPPVFAQRPPAPPPDEDLFTFPPSDIAQVPSMTPLGSINPAGMHVLPKDHMHFAFPHPASGGLDHVPVFAMAAGELVMVMRHPQIGAPAPLPLAAGEQVGIAKSYVHSWDIGVVDRRVRGDFAGHGERRYPNFNDFFRL